MELATYGYLWLLYAKRFGISDELKDYTNKLKQYDDDMLEHLYKEMVEDHRDNKLKKQLETLVGKIIIVGLAIILLIAFIN